MFGKFSNLSYKQGILLAFVVGFVVRLIPELLSFPYPIGWDTIYYAYRIQDGVLFGYWNDIFSTWLPYGIMIFLGNITRLDPFMLLKIIAPLFYGGCTAGIFFVAWKKLDWSVTKSLLVSVFFALQLAALDISWQFYRNIFGVALLLFAIPLLRKDLRWKEVGILSLLSLLVVLGHELAAVSLFGIVIGISVMCILKREKIPYRLLWAILPTVPIFLVNVFRYNIFSLSTNVDPNILSVGDRLFPHPGGLLFLTDYLSILTPNQVYINYFDLLSNVFSLFVLLYAVLLPLIIIGYFKDDVIISWTVLLLIGAFGCLVLPFSALILWHRWMLMLVFPFTFFAVNGLWTVLKTADGVSISSFFGGLKLTRKVGIGLSLLVVIIAGLFMTWPLSDGKYGLIGFGSTFKHVPSTMQCSSVPLQDTQDIINAYDFLNTNMKNNSSFLTHNVFEFWTLLYLKDDCTSILFDWDLQEALKLSSENGFSHSYLLWWNEPIGWYECDLLEGYDRVQDFGRLSVYEYM